MRLTFPIIKIFPILFLILTQLTLYGQEKEKIEIEKEIKAEELPSSILLSIKPLEQEGERFKYYQESDSVNTFYEVKLKFRGDKLSVKYTEAGKIFDLEVERPINSLPEEVQDSILNYFKEHHKKHKLKKLQLNYTYSDLEKDFIMDYVAKVLTGLTLKYEVEAYLKSKERNGLYELIFSSRGELIDIKKINSRAAEYVMY